MKTYFDFGLTGKKFLPVWILFLLLFTAPYIFLILKMNQVQDPGKILLFIPGLLILVIIAMGLTFYIAKLTIENVVLSENPVRFHGPFVKYIQIVVLGIFLSIVTFGVYSAWFIRDVQRFFTDNSSYNSSNFKFKGKGVTLFVILSLTIVLPVIVLSIAMIPLVYTHPEQSSYVFIIQELIIMVLMIPYIYLVYKWMVNIDYKEYNISWKTDFWNACGRILLELLLTLITAGIYMPLASLRLYKYFITKTKAAGNDSSFNFGYDIDPLNDFLFLWGQILLTTVTLGIYYPWAYSKIGKRILSRTYMERD